MVVLTWMSAWLFMPGPTTQGSLPARWDRWDAGIFTSIAQHWYFTPGTDPRHVAFFPGFPIAMWLAHLLPWTWTAAGLAVSAVAGAVATVALGRLAAAEVEEAWARRAGAGAGAAATVPRMREGLNGAEVEPGAAGSASAGGNGSAATSLDEGRSGGSASVLGSSSASHAAAASVGIEGGSASGSGDGSAASGSALGSSSASSAAAVGGSAGSAGSASALGSPAAPPKPVPTFLPLTVRAHAHRAAVNAALFFALAPAAVFLAAGYSESLFAAFAFSAWAAARRDRWGPAVVLAAGASAVRVNGLFLAAAIVLEFLLAGRGRRRWRQAPLLLVPAVPVAAYVVYLRRDTGDWFAWQHAQAAGWFRTFQTPKAAWDQTWRAAFGATQAGHTAWIFQLELVAVVVGLGLTALLLLKRRWPEALYVGLSLLALGTTTWFMSVPRAMLLWWPLWTMLGAWATRRPRVRTLYVCCVAPVMAGVALLFLSGQWAG
ncbi:mannosyltransferase family protein [Catenulispora sp. MAP5-51]|uniref:mannosyltransferase family protein n=1 Tax=unclassified Catenulispora TaxID=414885 RepID=UPI003513F0ED